MPFFDYNAPKMVAIDNGRHWALAAIISHAKQGTDFFRSGRIQDILDQTLIDDVAMRSSVYIALNKSMSKAW